MPIHEYNLINPKGSIITNPNRKMIYVCSFYVSSFFCPLSCAFCLYPFCAVFSHCWGFNFCVFGVFLYHQNQI